MKTWKTIALSVITTSTLVTGGALTYSYLQPTHYKGDTFTNAKTSVSSTTSSSSSSSSSKSESTNNIKSQQNTGDRAYQPTYKVVCVSSKYDLYCVEHIPTGDKTKAITYEQAESFCTYIEQIAYGKTSLSKTMDEYYNTWNGGTVQESTVTSE